MIFEFELTSNERYDLARELYSTLLFWRLVPDLG